MNPQWILLDGVYDSIGVFEPLSGRLIFVNMRAVSSREIWWVEWGYIGAEEDHNGKKDSQGFKGYRFN